MKVKIKRSRYKTGILNILKGIAMDVKNYGLMPLMLCIINNDLPVASGNDMTGGGCYYLDPNDEIELYD